MPGYFFIVLITTETTLNHIFFTLNLNVNNGLKTGLNLHLLITYIP